MDRKAEINQEINQLQTRIILLRHELDQLSNTKTTILHIVNDYFGVDVCERTRRQVIVKPRQLYCYLMNEEHPEISLNGIAATLTGLNYDHSDVIHAKNRFADELRLYRNTQQQYKEIKEKIKQANHIFDCSPY